MPHLSLDGPRNCELAQLPWGHSLFKAKPQTQGFSPEEGRKAFLQMFLAEDQQVLFHEVGSSFT